MSRVMAKPAGGGGGPAAQVAKKKRIIPAPTPAAQAAALLAHQQKMAKVAASDEDEEAELPVYEAADEETLVPVAPKRKMQKPSPPPPPPQQPQQVAKDKEEEDEEEANEGAAIDALFDENANGGGTMETLYPSSSAPVVAVTADRGGDPGAEQLFDDPDNNMGEDEDAEQQQQQQRAESDGVANKKKRPAVTFKVPDAAVASKKKKPAKEAVVATNFQSLSEKERYAAMAQYLDPDVVSSAKKTAAAAAAPPPHPVATAKPPPVRPAAMLDEQKPPSAWKKKAPAASAAAAAASPVFPHKDDQMRVVQYVRIMTFSLLKTGRIGEIGEDASDEQKAALDVARAFYIRCVMFRRQLLVALKELTANSPYMSQLIPAMAVCKLVVFNTPKALFGPAPSKKKGQAEEAQQQQQQQQQQPQEPVYCVWTGKPIPTVASIRAAALVPIEKSLSHSSGERQQDPLAAPIMFHVDIQYVNVLKCFHTLLFFMDYVTAEIHSKLESVRASLAAIQGAEGGEFDGDGVWAEMQQKGEDKKDPLVVLCTSSQTQLIECVKAVKGILPEKYLIVKTRQQQQPPPPPSSE